MTHSIRDKIHEYCMTTSKPNEVGSVLASGASLINMGLQVGFSWLITRYADIKWAWFVLTVYGMIGMLLGIKFMKIAQRLDKERDDYENHNDRRDRGDRQGQPRSFIMGHSPHDRRGRDHTGPRVEDLGQMLPAEETRLSEVRPHQGRREARRPLSSYEVVSH